MLTKSRIKTGDLRVGKISSRDEAVLNDSGSRCESFVYDFSEDGGATGSISFGRKIPSGAIVTGIRSDELTALTSGGSATILIKAGSVSLTAALAFDTAFTTAIDAHALATVDGLKVSADSELSITIGTAALTAGKVQFYIEYLIPNN